MMRSTILVAVGLAGGCYTGAFPEIEDLPDLTPPQAPLPVDSDTGGPIGPGQVPLDQLPAVVVGVSPAPGEAGVALDATLELRFSHDMLAGPNDLNASGPIFPADNTEAEWVSPRQFNVPLDLVGSETYQVTINGEAGALGFTTGGLNDVAWTYQFAFSSIGGSPDPQDGLAGAVLSTLPVSGSEGVDPALGTLEVVFSKPIGSANFASYSAGTAFDVEPVASFVDATSAELSVSLAPNRTYAVRITATDDQGLEVPEYLLSFRTGDAR